MESLDLTPRSARAVLGLAADAGPDEVTRAFRRLARLHHPDVSSAADAADRFAAISDAYDVAIGHPPRTTPPADAPATAPRPPAPPRAPAPPRRRPFDPPLVAGPAVVRPFPGEGR